MATITAIMTEISNGSVMRSPTLTVRWPTIGSCPLRSKSGERIGGSGRKKALAEKQEQIGELKAIRKAADQQLRYAESVIFRELVKDRLGEKEYMKLVLEAEKEIDAYKISGQMWHEYSRARGQSVTNINKL